MTDIRGDKTKQPEGCDTSRYSRNTCPNLKDVAPTWMDGERYRCEVCGESFTLYYDEMR